MAELHSSEGWTLRSEPSVPAFAASRPGASKFIDPTAEHLEISLEGKSKRVCVRLIPRPPPATGEQLWIFDGAFRNFDPGLAGATFKWRRIPSSHYYLYRLFHDPNLIVAMLGGIVSTLVLLATDVLPLTSGETKAVSGGIGIIGVLLTLIGVVLASDKA